MGEFPCKGFSNFRSCEVSFVCKELEVTADIKFIRPAIIKELSY